MLATSAGYQQMIAGNSVTDGIHRLNITLPGVGMDDYAATLVKASIEASTTTDQPDGTRFTVGYPSMQLTFTLADAAGIFAPYNTGSAMFRKTALQCAVTHDVGMLPPGAGGVVEWFRKFTGMVDTYVCNIDGSVDFTCIDNRGLLRSSVDIAAVVNAPPFNAGLTAEFAVDALLRNATDQALSSWFPQRSGCVLAVGMRASVWPERGVFTDAFLTGGESYPGFVFAPGLYGSALAGVDPAAAVSSLELDYKVENVFLTADIFFEFVASPGMVASINLSDLGGNTTANGSALVTYADGLVSIVIQDASAGADEWDCGVPADPDNLPHYIGVQIDWPSSGTTWSATVRFDGTTYSSGTRTSPVARHTNFGFVTIDTNPTGGTLESVIIAGVPHGSTPVWNDAFVPTAVLDPSLNPLIAIPAMSGDPWSVIQQVADAELAVAGFDEGGVFRFRNRTSIRAGTPVRTITSKTSLKTLQIEVSAASVYNTVEVSYAGWTYAAKTLVYTFANIQKVPARKKVSVTVNTDDLVAQVDGTAARLGNTHTTTDGASWFRASTDSSGLKEHPGVPTGDLTVTIMQVTANQFTVLFWNRTPFDAYMVSPAMSVAGVTFTDLPAGTPSVWIGGIPVTQGDPITVTQQFKDDPADFDITYQLGDNPWIQDEATATLLALNLLDDMCTPQPQLTGIEIVPDKALQLIDRIVITDDDVTGIDEHAVLWGWTWTDDGGESMTVDARAVAAPGQWILDVDGRSELDVTTYI